VVPMSTSRRRASRTGVLSRWAAAAAAAETRGMAGFKGALCAEVIRLSRLRSSKRRNYESRVLSRWAAAAAAAETRGTAG